LIKRILETMSRGLVSQAKKECEKAEEDYNKASLQYAKKQYLMRTGSNDVSNGDISELERLFQTVDKTEEVYLEKLDRENKLLRK